MVGLVMSTIGAITINIESVSKYLKFGKKKDETKKKKEENKEENKDDVELVDINNDETKADDTK